MASEVFRVLFLGDFAYGESYKTGGAIVLREHGYQFSTKHLQVFAEACDYFVVNLETPLAKKEEHVGGFNGEKPYIHWSSPRQAAQALANLGVDAVSLANNHSMDLGGRALASTASVLEDYGISWFGAGQDQSAAERPHRIPFPPEIGKGSILVQGSFEYRKVYDEKYEFYAKGSTAGSSYLSKNNIPSASPSGWSANDLRIAFPHWGSNYLWRSDRQVRYARMLVEAGYDLVIGHGSHAVQEIDQVDGRWVIHGIGNGMFQSGGRWRKYQKENGIVPFGFWTILEIRLGGDGKRWVSINLYPVYLDNRLTGFQPRPINETDFRGLLQVLAEKQSLPHGQISEGEDELGKYIRIEVGGWPKSPSPSLI